MSPTGTRPLLAVGLAGWAVALSACSPPAPAPVPPRPSPISPAQTFAPMLSGWHFSTRLPPGWRLGRPGQVDDFAVASATGPSGTAVAVATLLRDRLSAADRAGYDRLSLTQLAGAVGVRPGATARVVEKPRPTHLAGEDAIAEALSTAGGGRTGISLIIVARHDQDAYVVTISGGDDLLDPHWPPAGYLLGGWTWT